MQRSRNSLTSMRAYSSLKKMTRKTQVKPTLMQKISGKALELFLEWRARGQSATTYQSAVFFLLFFVMMFSLGGFVLALVGLIPACVITTGRDKLAMTLVTKIEKTLSDWANLANKKKEKNKTPVTSNSGSFTSAFLPNNFRPPISHLA